MTMFEAAPPAGIEDKAAGSDWVPVELVGVAVAVTRVVEVDLPLEEELEELFITY